MIGSESAATPRIPKSRVITLVIFKKRFVSVIQIYNLMERYELIDMGQPFI